MQTQRRGVWLLLWLLHRGKRLKHIPTGRPIRWAVQVVLLALASLLGGPDTDAFAGRLTDTMAGVEQGPPQPAAAKVAAAKNAPNAVDAFLFLQPGTGGNVPGPANGGTVGIGDRFVLDLMVNSGSNTDLIEQLSYLTFTYSLLQNARVSSLSTSCTLTSTVTGDFSVFESYVQNEVCNGPGTCDFGTGFTDPGSIAYTSFTFNTPVGGIFRVARIGLCATAPGQAVLHWQFSPPNPFNRNTEIDNGTQYLHDPTLFTDYVINVISGPTDTPTITPTPCPACTDTPTPTRTPTRTPTNTLTPTLTPTVTLTPTQTNTPCPGQIQTRTGSIAAGDPTQTSRLFRNGNPDFCPSHKVCPGTSGSDTIRYDTYSFVNTNPTAACFTISLDSTGCGANNLFTAAYQTSYNPVNKCNNYLGDAGNSVYPQLAVYSIVVPAGATFVIWVGETFANLGCASYTLTVDGFPCALTPTQTRTPTPTNTPTNTPTPTYTPTPSPVVVGHVFWQGRLTQPNPRQAIAITATLRLQSGGPYYDYTGLTTDASGFFTLPVGTLPNGLYNIRVKDPIYLASTASLSLTGALVTGVELGTQLAGDCDNSNVVNAVDFGILRNTFGKGAGDPGYDYRAEFTGDQYVDISDFGLFRNNFASGGSPPLRPVR